MKKEKQTEKVLKYMKAHGGITSMEAFGNLGITRLSGRIFELRKQGHVIKTEMITKKGSTYGVYRLEENDADQGL